MGTAVKQLPSSCIASVCYAALYSVLVSFSHSKSKCKSTFQEFNIAMKMFCVG